MLIPSYILSIRRSSTQLLRAILKEARRSTASSTFVATATPKISVFQTGPSLHDFIRQTANITETQELREPIDNLPWYRNQQSSTSNKRSVFFEIHGCQMNNSDAEVAWSVLQSAGYNKVSDVAEADVVLLLTCAIRDSAEQKIWKRLARLKRLKDRRAGTSSQQPLKIGVLGCMAERLKKELLEKKNLVDLVAGPDSYRDLPRLLSEVESGQTAVNVLLSKEETYADIVPVHLTDSKTTAFVSIQRGCDNFCSFCIVPFVRGKERSRPIRSIVEEVSNLAQKGVREVTLLGQNVNSYRDLSEISFAASAEPAVTKSAQGFHSIYKPKIGGLRFVDLLEKISDIDPEMRIRFQSPHPKDFPDEVLHLMRERPNICKQIHLPAQSGSTIVLKAMRRGYTRESYLSLAHHIRNILPEVAFTSDFIAGFCGESEADHQNTLALLREVGYSFIYTYPYSTRKNTSADKRLDDDVPQETKNRRFQEIANTFREIVLKINESRVGSVQLVLVEGDSKRSAEFLQGRCDSGTRVIFPKSDVSVEDKCDRYSGSIGPGDYVEVLVESSSSQVLHGVALRRTTMGSFY